MKFFVVNRTSIVRSTFLSAESRPTTYKVFDAGSRAIIEEVCKDDIRVFVRAFCRLAKGFVRMACQRAFVKEMVSSTHHKADRTLFLGVSRAFIDEVIGVFMQKVIRYLGV
ncbi:hypothetical protein E4U47_007317, partial [Claviceps purpurea]